MQSCVSYIANTGKECAGRILVEHLGSMRREYAPPVKLSSLVENVKLVGWIRRLETSLMPYMNKKQKQRLDILFKKGDIEGVKGALQETLSSTLDSFGYNSDFVDLIQMEDSMETELFLYAYGFSIDADYGWDPADIDEFMLACCAFVCNNKYSENEAKDAKIHLAENGIWIPKCGWENIPAIEPDDAKKRLKEMKGRWGDVVKVIEYVSHSTGYDALDLTEQDANDYGQFIHIWDIKKIKDFYFEAMKYHIKMTKALRWLQQGGKKRIKMMCEIIAGQVF